jgi:UDP-glucuronate decarboxylase
MAEFMLREDIDEIVANMPIGSLKEFGGKHVLLTGGRGFLGRYFTAVFQHLNEQHLVDRPVRLTVMDNLISAGPEGAIIPTIEHVTFMAHDCIQPLPDIGPVDFIIHAAGIASPAHYRKFPLQTLEVATIGLKNSLELARANPGCRLISFSSSEIYGDPDPANVPTTEAYRGNVACLGPRACYDMSKRLGETLVQIYQQQHGVAACIIRPFNVYGPGMQATDYRVLPNFGAKIAAGEPLQLYGTGNQTRTYCYVTDAIGGFLRVLMSGQAGEPYNIGNPSPELSVIDLAKLTETIVGDGFPGIVITPHPASYPADEPNRRCPDISKARSHVGYAPRVALEDGLRRFFAWTATAFVAEAKAA